MLARLRLRDRVPIVLVLFPAVVVAASLAVAAPPAAGANGVIVLPFEKEFVGTVSNGPAGGPANYYVGTVGDGGTIEMWVYDSRSAGRVQHFTATLELSLGGRSLTAVLDGRFNAQTLRVVLDGSVTEGWLAGARVHEESELVGFAPLAFAGTIRLMPGSAA